MQYTASVPSILMPKYMHTCIHVQTIYFSYVIIILSLATKTCTCLYMHSCKQSVLEDDFTLASIS